jgi:hypothetical protein
MVLVLQVGLAEVVPQILARLGLARRGKAIQEAREQLLLVAVAAVQEVRPLRL